jgi:hypothetical protein
VGAIWPFCFLLREDFFDFVDFFDEVKLEVFEEDEDWGDTRRE